MKSTEATVTDLSSHIAEKNHESSEGSLNGNLKQKEWDLILNAMSEVKGSRKLTAQRLGISERTLRYKLAKMRDAGISIPGRSAEVI